MAEAGNPYRILVTASNGPILRSRLIVATDDTEAIRRAAKLNYYDRRLALRLKFLIGFAANGVGLQIGGTREKPESAIMLSAPPVHLVGSVRLANEEEVFRAIAAGLGTRARRYPDGETGERHYWIRWQKKIFENNPHLELAGQREGYRKDTAPLPYYRLRSAVAPSDLSFSGLGYADAAINSYKTFARLQNEGVIPAPVRLMVALPTPVAVITTFMLMEQRAAAEPAYEHAMIGELERIIKALPSDKLAIQWDVCHEILAADGAFPLHYGDILAGTFERLARMSKAIPDTAEFGIHLCYGDPEHKHIKEPADTATAVAFANGISQHVGRRIDWMHMPVPRDRSDDPYFAALKNLKLRPETQLVLGLVHFSDGFDGTMQRVRAAQKVVSAFGVATECGFGRRSADSIARFTRA